MSAPVPAGRRRDHAPLERALAVWLLTVVVFGAAWLYGVFRAGDDLRPVLAWAGGAAALALSVTIAAAAYYAALASRAREDARAEAGGGAASLERQIAEVADVTLPGLLHRIGSGAPADRALREILPPADPALQRLLQVTALDAAARRHDVTAAQDEVVAAKAEVTVAQAKVTAAEDEMAAAKAGAATATAVMEALDAEVDRLVNEAMPVVVARVRRDRVGPETLLPEVGEPESPPLRRLFARVVDDLATGERGSAAAMMSCANAAARIQAACTRLLGDLRDLEHRYGDDPVFHDLLDIDHEVSQAGRIADSIALLAGGRSGRRWTKPIRMESILRGAMGRIHDYRRVKLHFTTGSAIAGYAAEGVMHCLAELMDNAASFSATNTDVHVYVEEEDAGMVITIEDSGLGMRRRERARAERLVNEPSDLTALPGTRLGLAVVGRLAAKHALRISFRPSSRGGTAAIVLIPRQLVTQPRQDLLPPELREPWDGSIRPPLAGTPLHEEPSPVTAVLTERAPVEPSPAASFGGDVLDKADVADTAGSWDVVGVGVGDVVGDLDDDAFELPQRTRGATLASSPDPVPADIVRKSDRPAPGERFAAFRSATGGPRTVARDTGASSAPEVPKTRESLEDDAEAASGTEETAERIDTTTTTELDGTEHATAASDQDDAEHPADEPADSGEASTPAETGDSAETSDAAEASEAEAAEKAASSETSENSSEASEQKDAASTPPDAAAPEPDRGRS